MPRHLSQVTRAMALCVSGKFSQPTNLRRRRRSWKPKIRLKQKRGLARKPLTIVVFRIKTMVLLKCLNGGLVKSFIIEKFKFLLYDVLSYISRRPWFRLSGTRQCFQLRGFAVLLAV